MRVGRGTDAELVKRVFLLIAAAHWQTDVTARRLRKIKATEHVSHAGGIILPLMALLAGFFCKSERKKKIFTPTITNSFLSPLKTTEGQKHVYCPFCHIRISLSTWRGWSAEYYLIMRKGLFILLLFLFLLEVKVERPPDSKGKSCTSEDCEDDWQAIIVIANRSISPQKW